jgi:hypothetical protein
VQSYPYLQLCIMNFELCTLDFELNFLALQVTKPDNYGK